MDYDEKAIVQNMKDAGCKDACIQEFLLEYRNGARKRCGEVLSGHRRTLLENLHRVQKQIDCLDYLRYRIEKQQSGRA